MAKSAKPRIGIVGAGLGGLTAGALLQSAGYHVDIYEQTPSIVRLGAGIHLGPEHSDKDNSLNKISGHTKRGHVGTDAEIARTYGFS